MPNHVTNCFTISGHKAEIEKIIIAAGIQAPSGEFNSHKFDFNGFIPMPEALANSQAGYIAPIDTLLAHADINQNLLDDKIITFENFSRIAKKLNISGLSADALNDLVKDGYAEKPLSDYLEFAKNDPVKFPAFQRAKDALQNQALYGYTDWYNWACAEWGTKWNAYEVSATLQIGSQATQELDRKAFDALDAEADVTLNVQFDTAWSVPEPIFDHIIENYQVTLQGESLDELGNFACDYYTITHDNGSYLEICIYDDFDTIKEFCCRIFGYSPFEDGEDDELDTM